MELLPKGIGNITVILCAHCGGVVNRFAGDLNRPRRRDYKTFCNMKCFREASTKYPGLTPKERQNMHDRNAKRRKKEKLK